MTRDRSRRHSRITRRAVQPLTFNRASRWRLKAAVGANEWRRPGATSRMKRRRRGRPEWRMRVHPHDQAAAGMRNDRSAVRATRRERWCSRALSSACRPQPSFASNRSHGIGFIAIDRPMPSGCGALVVYRNRRSDMAASGSTSTGSNIVGEVQPRHARVVVRILPRILPASSQRVAPDSLL